MSTIHETVKEEVKKAMLAKETVKLEVLRSILSAFTNELVAQKRPPSEILDDKDATTVVKHLVKQHKDSIAQFQAGGRDDLVANEKAELVYLEEYAPKMARKDEIKPVAERKKSELGINDRSKMGILIGAVMKEFGGNADGADVKAVVENLFS